MGAFSLTVNGQPQRAECAELLLREQMARGAADTPALREGVREALVQDALMAQAAVRGGLHELPLVQAQIELARQNILARAWQQQWLQDQTVSEAELHEAHERQVAAMGRTELRVRHLVAREESTARTWLYLLQAGEPMADLARDSLDAASAQAGGLVDWTPEGRLQPAIAQVLAGLVPGQRAAQPVQTPAGWHVLQLVERRPLQAPGFEASRAELARVVAQERLQGMLQTLRDQAIVE